MADRYSEWAVAFWRLLEGYADAHGTHGAAIPSQRKGGKLEIKGTASTVQRPVTAELWAAHLRGERPLGIVPIRADSTCLWGAIDIDSYDISHAELVDTCRREGLPLVVCRTKSGGAHLFLFAAEPVPAELMQRRLQEMAALIGHGGAEVFPKQRTLAVERGDLGSWLNMPYFRGDDTERYAFKAGGLAMTVDEFLAVAEAARQPASELEGREYRRKPKKDSEWSDCPPCMAHLASVGYPEGSRNRGLFALAVLAKKKHPVNWKDRLEQWNRELFDPPLPAEEVTSIIRSHEKKDYNYTCKDAPLKPHCNSAVCRSRKYGVGGDEDRPSISGMSILDTDPPVWFLDVNGERLELSTDELQNYKLFHKRCMERLHLCFGMMKQDTWLQIVAEAMRDATRIEVSPEVSRMGHFEELVSGFVLDRHRGEAKEDMLVGRPWEDTEAGRHYFRLKDLQKYLRDAGQDFGTRGQLVSRLRSMGGGKHFFVLKNHGTNVWYVPAGAQATPTPDVPPIQREPI